MQRKAGTGAVPPSAIAWLPLNCLFICGGVKRCWKFICTLFLTTSSAELPNGFVWERGVFSGSWISAMFWDGWRSLLEDGGKSWGPLRVLAYFAARWGGFSPYPGAAVTGRKLWRKPWFAGGAEACGAAGQGPTSASPLRTLWGTATFAGSKLLTPVLPATRGKLSVKCFPTLQTLVVVFPGNGSTDQMFHRVIENSILSESICCQKVLSLLQQRGWLDPSGPELASLRLGTLFCDSGSYSSLGFAHTGTFFFKSLCPLPNIAFVQVWLVFSVWMCTST